MNTRALAALAALVLVLPATRVHAGGGPAPAPGPKPAPIFPMTVDTLPNGLTVVTVPMAHSGAVAFYTLVRAGSRDEVEPGRSGYAHLFEHLMFRGTAKIPAADYEKRMQAMGSDNNAFTTDDFTFFTPLVPKESLAELVPVEADRFQHLDVAERPYKDETGAVLGEYNKDFSNPYWFMDEALHELAFKQHTYGHTTLGFKRDVEAMPRNYAYSKLFFSRFYTPDDCVIFAVGDVERERVLALVKQSYGDWKGKRAQPAIKKEPAQTAPRVKALVWKGPTTPRMIIAYKVPAASQVDDVAALSVLATLVFGEPSELYQRLVVKEQKAIALEADPDETLHKDPGVMRVDVRLKPGVAFADITGAVQSSLDAVAGGAAKPADVEAARRHLVSSITLSMQTPGAVAERIAYLAATTGDVHGFNRYMAAVEQVTPADIARVAKAYLVPARRDVVTLSPPPPAKAKAPKKGDTTPKKGGKK